LNIYMSIGIFTIALGTFLMSQMIDNKNLIILGAITNTIGLFLMTKGSLISSKKDKSEIIEKIKGFREEILLVKNTESSNESNESLDKIGKIESEFNEWADNFLGDIESRKVEQLKSDILIKEKEINLSKKWRHIYQYFFETIKQMLSAYNEKAKIKIEFTLPELPDSLFDKEAESFKSVIIFDDINAWTITLSILKPLKEDVIPNIVMYFFSVESAGNNVREYLSRGYGGKLIVLVFDAKDESFRVHWGDSNFHIRNIETTYSISMDGYKTSIKELVKALIEFQIINLKS
jgi:hypothetical protein